MFLLLSALLALQDEEIRATFHFIRASSDERARIDGSLKEVEGELKELTSYNSFEIVGSAIVRFSPTCEGVETSLAVRDAGGLYLRFKPQQPFGGRIFLSNLSLLEHRAQEDVQVTGTGGTLRTVRHVGHEVMKTSVEAPEGKLRIVGTAVITGKGGPTTVVVAVRAAMAK